MKTLQDLGFYPKGSEEVPVRREIWCCLCFKRPLRLLLENRVERGKQGQAGSLLAGKEGLFPLTPLFVDRDSELGVTTRLPTRSAKWPFLSLGQDDFSSSLCPQDANVGKPDRDAEWPWAWAQLELGHSPALFPYKIHLNPSLSVLSVVKNQLKIYVWFWVWICYVIGL